jgi:DNA polymerase (family 10)
MAMNNARIADLFDEVADLLEFTDANPFRVRAYRNGARTIRDLGESLATIKADADRALTDIAGIGKDLAAKIVELLDTGELAMHRQLLTEIPSTALELLRVPGLGPKKAAVLLKELGIASLDQLRAACEEHRVQKLKGFGAKTEQTILAGLPMAAKAHERLYWAEADIYVQSLLEYLRGTAHVERIEAAGSYRRGRETVGDIDLLAVAAKPQEVMDRLVAYEGVSEVLARGETKTSVRLSGGLQVDLRVVPAESFGAALQYFTGSKDHNVVLRGMAKARGLKINEYGVYRGDEYVAGQSEDDVYATLGLPCFPPELREARQEFDWAATGKLPKLIEVDQIIGDLHMHTDATDGKSTLDEMVEAAAARGLKYIAITDHSKRVSMANGLDGERARAQWKTIDALNRRHPGIQVLKGIECDILEKGGMDLDDDVLAEADWVVASVHYGQKQPREQITQRIVDAIRNPHVSAIAHPTGRIINRRESYEVDLEQVFRAAADYGKLLELNANPARLDLDDVACAAAKSHGIPIVISTDAHGTLELDKLRYGVLQARRAGLTAADVANTRPWKELKKLIGRKGS